MDSFKDFIKDNRFYIAAGSAVVGTSLLLYKKFKKRTRTCGVDYPKDTVILHVYPGNKHIPNLGHFVMKLETYLRITNIPYQYDFNYEGAPKNKSPWIEYNGVTMGDSQLIMEYLNKNLKIDINSHLSKQERAVAWAIQKWLEEFTYWLNVHYRWVISPGETLKKLDNITGFQAVIIKLLMLPQARKMTYTVGVGKEEISQMILKDIRQFSEILGDKKFIMGDKVTETDCAAFGVLSQIRWCTPESCPGHQLLASGEVQNVTDYLDRIKNTYWKDWEKVQEILNSVGRTDLWINQRTAVTKYTHHLVKRTLIDSFIQSWHESMENSSRGRIYSSFKHNFECEQYFKILPKSDYLTLYKIRACQHRFPVEILRYEGIPYHERTCTLCDSQNVGNERHYILSCSYFDEPRNRYLGNLNITDSDFWFQKLLNSTSEEILLKLCKFIRTILKRF